MVDILPCELTWAPECPEPQACYSGYIFRLADEQDDYFRGGQYTVPHYAKQAYGQAFGPLGMDQVIQFCHILGERIRERGWVIVATEPDDLPGRANAAVLLGAYLLLRKGWSVERLRQVLIEDAQVGFPCSWSNRRAAAKLSAAEASAEAVMEVVDCWSGLEMARNRGWLPDNQILSDATLVACVCSKYRRMLLEYDCAWLEPGFVMVSADPTTTVRDPNPSTCRSLEPQVKGSKLAKRVERPVMLSERPQMMAAHAAAPMAEQFEATKKRASVHNSFKLRLPAGSESDRTPSEAMPGGHQSLLDSLDDDDRSTHVSEASEASTRVMALNSNGVPSQPGLSVFSTTATPQSTGQDPAHAFSRRTSATTSDEEAGRQGQPLAPVPAVVDDASSCHTVCKLEYGEAALDRSVLDTRRGAPKDFVSFCEDNGVTTVLRVNMNNEAGIHEYGGSYDPQVFRRHGIHQLDVPVADKEGGVPSAADIQAAMHGCERVEKGGKSQKAVLVHCKGGFGRSVVFACCLLIWEHNIPGRSLLGWVRIVRPGAICTPEQERFLCKMRGRDDLRRHIAVHSHNACCVVS